ncbi:MAG: O-Antigen polymerase family [Candidatus Rokubacteria bacterium CSP1-6]|nr:MAG: O-Antigen polymerase family [Candidatus Rokubacteria bacterium CSP1-6]
MSDARSVRRWVLGLFLVGLAFSITLAESILAVLVGFWLLRLRDKAARVPESFPLAGPVLAFAAATLLSALRSGNPWTSLLDAKGLLLVLVLYVLVAALPDADAADRFLTGLFLLVAVHAGLGILQVVLCPPREPAGVPLLSRFFHRCDRAHGFFSIYMTFAGVLTLILLATLPRLLERARPRRWWTALGWGISGAALVATFTRGAWFGFLAAATGLSLALRRYWALAAIGGAVLAASVLFLLSDGVPGRLHKLEDPATIRERLYMWESGWAMFRDRPLTGVGPGQVKIVFPRYARPEAVRKTTSHVHNTPLQILAERGVLGLAAWVWIWVAFFARAGRLLGRLGPHQGRERGLVAGSLVAIGGFLVAGLSEFNFGDSEVVMVAYALMALPFVVERGVRHA